MEFLRKLIPIVSAISTVAAAAATFAGFVPEKYGFWIVTISGCVSAVTDKIQHIVNPVK